MKPLVYVIILNYNGSRWLDRCLASLRQTAYPNYRVLLVDNASTDGSVEAVRARFPQIEMIENNGNLGFSEGNNVGMRRALERGADYIVLLNPDTWVEPDWLSELIAVGEADESIGILGAVQLQYDSDDFNAWTSQAARQHLPELRAPESARAFLPMEWVEGACLAIKRKALEHAGMLDPIYFAFYEEIDLCRRVLCCGYQVGLAPRSRIHHFRGGTWEANAAIKRDRDYRCDRSQFIFASTDPRRTLAANLAWYAITLGTKLKSNLLHPEGIGRLLKMQMDLIFSAGPMWEKWRRDRRLVLRQRG